MSETKEREALVGLCPVEGCGAVVMACVIEPKHSQTAAEFAGDAVKHGYRLETWTCERVRTSTWDCAHTEAKRAAGRGSATPQLELAEPAR